MDQYTWKLFNELQDIIPKILQESEMAIFNFLLLAGGYLEYFIPRGRVRGEICW